METWWTAEHNSTPCCHEYIKLFYHHSSSLLITRIVSLIFFPDRIPYKINHDLGFLVLYATSRFHWPSIQLSSNYQVDPCTMNVGYIMHAVDWFMMQELQWTTTCSVTNFSESGGRVFIWAGCAMFRGKNIFWFSEFCVKLQWYNDSKTESQTGYMVYLIISG